MMIFAHITESSPKTEVVHAPFKIAAPLREGDIVVIRLSDETLRKLRVFSIENDYYTSPDFLTQRMSAARS